MSYFKAVTKETAAVSKPVRQALKTFYRERERAYKNLQRDMSKGLKEAARQAGFKGVGSVAVEETTVGTKRETGLKVSIPYKQATDEAHAMFDRTVVDGNNIRRHWENKQPDVLVLFVSTV